MIILVFYLKVMLLILMGISLVFSLIFHFGTKEPLGELDKKSPTTTNAGVVNVRNTLWYGFYAISLYKL